MEEVEERETRWRRGGRGQVGKNEGVKAKEKEEEQEQEQEETTTTTTTTTRTRRTRTRSKIGDGVEEEEEKETKVFNKGLQRKKKNMRKNSLKENRSLECFVSFIDGSRCKSWQLSSFYPRHFAWLTLLKKVFGLYFKGMFAPRTCWMVSIALGKHSLHHRRPSGWGFKLMLKKENQNLYQHNDFGRVPCFSRILSSSCVSS